MHLFSKKGCVRIFFLHHLGTKSSSSLFRGKRLLEQGTFAEEVKLMVYETLFLDSNPILPPIGKTVILMKNSNSHERKSSRWTYLVPETYCLFE